MKSANKDIAHLFGLFKLKTNLILEMTKDYNFFLKFVVSWNHQLISAKDLYHSFIAEFI